MDRQIKKSLLNFALAGSTPWLVAFLWRSPFILTGVLFAIGVVMLVIEKDKNSVLLYIVAGIGGAITEIISIYFGAWIYTEPTFAGIPIWLPFLWGAAGLFVLRLKKFIDAIFRK